MADEIFPATVGVPGSLPVAVAQQGEAPLTGPPSLADPAPPSGPTPPAPVDPPVLRAEIATDRKNLFIPPVYDGIRRPRDPTLRTRGGGWDYSIYETVEQDPKVYSAMQKRKAPLGAFPFQIDPASDAPADVEAAEMVKRAFAQFNFPAFVKDQLDAIMKGFAVSELIWDLVDGEWRPVETKKRDQRRFRFGEFGELRLLDWSNALLGLPVPPRKFVVHSFNPQDGDPYGRGLGLMLWFNAWFRRQNKEAWLIHNEKYGAPTPWGTYPAQATEDEKEALFNALMSFQTDGAMMSPDGTMIKLIESARAAGADTFKVFSDNEGHEIAEIILGSSAAAQASPLNGGTAADVDQADRLELAKSDANDLAFTLQPSLIQWLCELNTPGARRPTIKWLIDAEEDLNERAERDEKVAALGYRPSDAYIQQTYGGHWTPIPAAPPPELPALPGPNAAFAEASPAEAVAGALAAQLAKTAAPAIDGWIGKFRQVIHQSASLEEARDKLISLYAEMDPAHFAETMHQALQLADLAGRVDVTHGG